MDVYLKSRVSSPFFLKAVSRQLPPDIELLEVHTVPFALPSLQSQVSHAEYQVEVESDKSPAEVQAAIERLLELEHLPWEHHRDTGPHRYDLRPLVADLWLVECRNGCCVLGMRLRCDNRGAGRPEQVAAALGFPPPHRSIQRTRLIISGQR
jgi:radical SAM-linked protein